MVLKTSGRALRTLSCAFLGWILAGCLGSTPVVRLAEPATVAVHIVLEDAAGARVETPVSLPLAVNELLAERNLQPVWLEPAELGADLGTTRATPARVEALRAAAPNSDFVLLVQANARYFTQIAGRFRWDVALHTSFGSGAAGATTTESDTTVGAHLLFEHEREADALAYVRRQVADEVALVLDRTLASDPRPKAANAPHRDAVYFVMIDRFARPDGAEKPPTAITAWHGGTFAGLVKRLGWLEDLGVGAIWLSPPFATRDEAFFGHPAWHGYWTSNLMKTHGRFGSEAELVELGKVTSAAGMGLWLDLVVNHVGPETPLVASKPGWFRRARPIDDWNDRQQLEEGQVHGLPDLDQSHPEVRAYLFGATRHWLDALPLAGLRLDAVKHVSPEFWHDFNTTIAGERPELGFLAEILDGDPLEVERVARAGAFTGVFDFALHYALLDTFCRGQGAGPLGSALSVNLALDDSARARGERPLERFAFLDNHDLPRVMHVCGEEVERVALALDGLVTLPARPVLTWGTEVGLTGGREPETRAPMRFDAAHPLVARTREALSARAMDRALTHGATRVEAFGPGGALAFSRLVDGAGTLVVVNPTDTVQRLRLPAHLGLAAVDAPAQRVVRHRVVATARARSAPVTVELRVAGAPEGDVAVVGADPALGGWSPGQAPRTREGRVAVRLAPGRLYAFKLVAGLKDAAPVWEARSNRYLLVDAQPDDGPLRLTLRWEEA